jgi:hypothetical protein
MLTLSKVELYAQFRGDSDGFSRSGMDSNAAGMTPDDWSEIARLRQALFVVASGRASAQFVADTERRLTAVTPDEATRAKLRDFVDDYDRPSPPNKSLERTREG